MKVLHTVASLQSHNGGPAQSVPGLACALANAGCEVSLWSPDIPEGFVNPSNIRILSSAELPAELFDIVHDHGIWLPVNHKVTRWAKEHTIPRIVSPRGMLEPWSLKHRWLKKKLAWFLYQKRDLRSAIALHATADSEAQNFQKCGLGGETIVLPNGIPIQKNISSPKKEKKAVFLGRIHPKKGLPILVEAWRKVFPDGWKMHVAGPDELNHTQEVRDAVQKAGLSGVWRFHDQLSGGEKTKYLAEAELLILPTYSENFGIVVAEALALGVPVITTTGTPWQRLTTYNAGWWVDPDVDSISRALSEATGLSVEERKLMGVRGAKWVNKEFSWEDIGARMKGEYERVLDGYRS